MSRGNASVAATVLNSIKEGSGTFGLISAVPYTIHTSVKFHHEEPANAEGGKLESLAEKSFARMSSFFGGRSFAEKAPKGGRMERTSSPMDPTAQTCEFFLSKVARSDSWPLHMSLSTSSCHFQSPSPCPPVPPLFPLSHPGKILQPADQARGRGAVHREAQHRPHRPRPQQRAGARPQLKIIRVCAGTRWGSCHGACTAVHAVCAMLYSVVHRTLLCTLPCRTLTLFLCIG